MHGGLFEVKRGDARGGGLEYLQLCRSAVGATSVATGCYETALLGFRRFVWAPRSCLYVPESQGSEHSPHPTLSLSPGYAGGEGWGEGVGARGRVTYIALCGRVFDRKRRPTRLPPLRRNILHFRYQLRMRQQIHWLMRHLPARGIFTQIRSMPIVRRAHRSWGESAAAVRAYVVQELHAAMAERTFERADHRVRRLRRQRFVAVFAGGTKFQHDAPPVATHGSLTGVEP